MKKVREIKDKRKCPSQNDINNAVKIASDFKLSIYQALYEYGLVEPGNIGGKYKISFYNDIIAVIRIIPTVNKSYAFSTRTPKEALEKTILIDDAIRTNKNKIHDFACCPLAEFNNCVCHVSFNCPVHGNAQCHGTHD